MKTALLLALSALPCVANAQYGMDILDHNNSSAILSNQGTLFNDDVNDLQGYEVPKGSGLNAIYGLQFWFGGKTATGAIHTALGGNASGTKDVFNGPYSTTDQYSIPSYNQPYIITLCQDEIDNFILWYACNEDPSTPGCDDVYGPSNSTLDRINSWPAHGDVANGQSFDLAPFFDRDNNGFYDPAAGDYPIIKGCCATYMIQNDHANSHTFSGTAKVGIEMHYLIYQYASSDFLNDATFIDVMAINRGTTDYVQFAHGLMLDADVGFSIDDYFGSDSTTNTMFFYNADNLDETGYLANPPAIGITALESSISTCTAFSNYGSPAENWNVMNGKLPNGADIVNPSGTPTTYQYSGNPVDASAWNETSAGNPFGDRRGAMTSIHGPLAAGDTITQTYVVLFAQGGTNLQNADQLITQAAQAKALYENDAIHCVETVLGLPDESLPGLSIYPNPTSNLFFIENEQAGSLIIEVVDLSGRTIISRFESSQALIQIEMGAVASGSYLVNVLDGEKKSTAQLIVNK
jgi:hypothetical protein